MILDVIIPTFGRADRLPAVLTDVRASLDGVDHVVTIVGEQDDPDTKRAWASATHGRYRDNLRTATYAGAVNTACLATEADFVFMGADDLHFHAGWFQTAHALMGGQTQVVGTNDLHNPHVLAGTNSTHHLVDMRYIRDVGGTVDQGPGVALFEGYDHNYVDTEFIDTAKARGVFRSCLDSVVEHLHPNAGKAPHDATYDRSTRHYGTDAALFRRRQPQWLA